MSEARFRAWDKIEKKMWYPIVKPDGRLMASNQLGGYVTYDDPQDPLMQHTGRKDKNGKEVYEGDVVAFDEGITKGKQTEFERWVVQALGGWECTCGDYYCNESGVGFSVKGYHGYYRDNGTIDKYNDIKSIVRINMEIEVIGNIYENPELLEDK